MVFDDPFDSTRQRQQARELRQSRDLADEASGIEGGRRSSGRRKSSGDRDTRRRSSTDGLLLEGNVPGAWRIVPGLANGRFLCVALLVLVPYTMLMLFTLNTPKEQRSPGVVRMLAGFGVFMMLGMILLTARAVLQHRDKAY